MKDRAVPELTFFGAGRENVELEAELMPEIARVMASNQHLNGPDVHAFEDAVATATGRAHAVATGSATDALFFIMSALGIGQGDEVLVPAYSFAASATAILRTGAHPVFVDIQGADGAMDLDDAAQRITPATKAMLWVGLFGGLSEPSRIKSFAEEADLILIEDAAQSFGAFWQETPAGQLGRAAGLSFDRNKVLGAPGTGGAVVTDEADIANAVRSLRYHGKDGAPFSTLGYNSQMSDLTAAVLNVKLRRHPAWCARRRKIAAIYDAALANLPVQRLTWDDRCTHAFHKFVFRTEHRDAWRAHLDKSGIPTRIHYATPLPHEPVFAASVANHRPWPRAQLLSQTALSLPIYAQLTDDEVAHIASVLAAFVLE